MKLWYCCLSLFVWTSAGIPLSAQSKNASTAIHRLLDGLPMANSADQYVLVRQLTHYALHEFDPVARARIGALLQPEQIHLREWVLLAGFLGLETSLNRLLEAKALSPNLRQTIRFALVRCGDGQQLQRLLHNMRTIPVNDDFVYGLVPLLVYTRRREVTDYLLELIQKDDQACMPADAETPGAINCAYRIMEYLAPVIRDFPLKIDGSGDLDTDNYPQALKTVRVWMMERRGAYVLNTTTY